MVIFICVLTLWALVACCCSKKQLNFFSLQATLPLRGVLALGITFHHISQRIDWLVPDCPWWISQFSFVGAPIVAVFFFLSGYGLMASLGRKGEIYLEGFIRKRLFKIVLPLLLASLVFEVVSYSLWGGKLAVNMRNDWPFLPTCWFCVAIIVYYLAFYVIAFLCHSSLNKVACGMWLFTCLYMGMCYIFDFRNWWFQSVLSLNVGMSVACYEETIRRYLLKYHKIILFVLCLFVFFFAYWANWGGAFPFGFISLSSVIGLLFYVLLSLLPIKKSLLLNTFGCYSYEIYLVQGAICSSLFNARYYTYVLKWYPELIVLSFLFTIFSAWMLRRAMLTLEKYLP